MNRHLLAAWAGMIGPALFVATFTIEGWLRPGYDARSMFISELALGPRGWVQVANFLVYGTLLLIFTWGIAAEFPTGKASKAGPILLAIIGISFVASGFFVMDPPGTLPEQATLHGTLHGLFGALVFSLMPITCFVFLRRFRADPQWQSLVWWTLAAGTISALAVIVMSVGPTEPPAAPNAFNAWNGFIQRTALIPFMVWQFVFALRLYRLTSQAPELGITQ
jgi:hypothetical membrane protein